MNLTRFAKYAWGTLAYNVAVVVWGAYVRATGSGAGCGKHWPTCQGAVIPRAPQIETLVEFSHRLTSGLAFLAVLGLFVWAWRAYPKKHIVRTGAALSMGFILLESLVGAGLGLCPGGRRQLLLYPKCLRGRVRLQRYRPHGRSGRRRQHGEWGRL